MTIGGEISGYFVFQVKGVIWFCQLRMGRMGTMCYVCVREKCEGQILQGNNKEANITLLSWRLLRCYILNKFTTSHDFLVNNIYHCLEKRDFRPNSSKIYEKYSCVLNSSSNSVIYNWLYVSPFLSFQIALISLVGPKTCTLLLSLAAPCIWRKEMLNLSGDFFLAYWLWSL